MCACSHVMSAMVKYEMQYDPPSVDVKRIQVVSRGRGPYQ